MLDIANTAHSLKAVPAQWAEKKNDDFSSASHYIYSHHNQNHLSKNRDVDA